MPIQVSCDECGKPLRYPDERAGQTVTCKGCGADIELPGGRRRSGTGKKKKKKSSGAPIGVIIGGGVAILFVGVLVAVIAFWPKKQQQAQIDPNNPGATGTQPGAPANPGTNPPGIAANTPTGAHGAPANPAGSSTNRPAMSGFQKKTDDRVFKPVANWKVQVDPAASPVEAGSGKSFSIKTESGFLQQKSVIWPEGPSPLAMINENDSKRDVYQIWNMTTGTKGAEIKGPQFSSQVGISPDGSLVAWFRFKGGGSGIEVYDVADKKTLGVLPLDGQAFNVAALAMPTSKRLLAVSNVNRGVMSWTLPSGEPEWQIKLGEHGQGDPHRAFTPGGRYMALLASYMTRAIDFYDLNDGSKAGSIEMVARSPDLLGMSFSHDGTEFAAAYGTPFTKETERIVIWNAAKGEIVSDFELPDPEERTRDKLSSKTSLQWFDKKRLLLNGTYLIDRDAKKVVYALPQPTLDFDSLAMRRVIADTTLIGWEGTNKSAKLSPIEIKSEDVARAQEIAASGGLMIDARLPKLTAIDRQKAADKSGPVSGWNASADPPPGPTPTTVGATRLTSGPARSREIQFSRADAGIVGVRLAEEDDDLRANVMGFNAKTHYIHGDKRNRMRNWTPPVPCRRNWIELVDAGQKKSTKIDIPFGCELTAINPDGSKVLVQPAEGEGRLDVFASDGQHVAGCRPFQYETEVEKRHIASAAFVTSDTVVACSLDDRLVAFRLPACEPIYRIDDAGTVAVSPGRKFIAISAENRIELRDAATGEGRGTVAVDAPVLALAFAPRGDRLAALTSGRQGSSLVVVDLASGNPSTLPIPQSSAPLFWSGEQQVVVTNTNLIPTEGTKGVLQETRSLMLIDLGRQGVLWSYPYGLADKFSIAQSSFDGRTWLAGPMVQGRPDELVALELRGPDKASLEKMPASKPVVQPGATVSLKLDIASPAGQQNYPQRAREIVDRLVKNNDLKVKDGEPLTLIVSITQAPANEVSGQVQLQLMKSANVQTTMVSIERKGAKIRVGYELAGKPVWGNFQLLTNDIFGFVQFTENKDVQTVVDEQLWKNALATMEMNLPPPNVFSAESAKGLGTTLLRDEGVRAAKK